MRMHLLVEIHNNQSQTSILSCLICSQPVFRSIKPIEEFYILSHYITEVGFSFPNEGISQVLPNLNLQNILNGYLQSED